MIKMAIYKFQQGQVNENIFIVRFHMPVIDFFSVEVLYDKWKSIKIRYLFMQLGRL